MTKDMAKVRKDWLMVKLTQGDIKMIKKMVMES